MHVLFTWWFSALIVLGFGVIIIEFTPFKNFFGVTTVGFIFLLLFRTYFFGLYAIIPDYIDVIPYLIVYILLNVYYGKNGLFKPGSGRSAS